LISGPILNEMQKEQGPDLARDHSENSTWPHLSISYSCSSTSQQCSMSKQLIHLCLLSSTWKLKPILSM